MFVWEKVNLCNAIFLELLGKTQLLSRSFVSTPAKVRVTDGGTAAGSPVMNGSAASTIKIMQWNILAQGNNLPGEVDFVAQVQLFSNHGNPIKDNSVS